MLAQSATVLIVDDEAAVRRLVARSLAGFGFATREAEHGAAALRILASAEPIHLVISDINMPTMDGPTLARELRATRPLLPILFITGREPPDLTGEILRKPFSPEALLIAVSKVLGRAAGGSRSSAS